MARDLEALFTNGEQEEPVHVEGKAVVGLRSAAGADAAAVVDVQHQVRVQEDEPGRLPGQAQARQVLDDLGVTRRVQPGDEADIGQRAASDRLPGHLAEAQRRVPLGVEIALVEAVAAPVVEVVDEEEAVAVLPLRRLLQGQDEALFLLSRERVQQFAELKVELGLRGSRRSSCGKRGEDGRGGDGENAPPPGLTPSAAEPHATSNSPAAPMPPPMHIVTTTFFAPRRLPSIKAWPTRRAPLMP